MTMLTPEMVAQRLDVFVRRHTDGRREITTNDMRAYLRNLDQRWRIRAVAKELGVPVETVTAIWTALLKPAP